MSFTPKDSTQSQLLPFFTSIFLALWSFNANAAPNFIFMIGDDLATETLSCYEVGSNQASTPTLDTLCEDGMRLDNFWAQPVCSPTRATLLTGRYGFRTGVRAPVGTPNAIANHFPYAEKASGTPTESPTGVPGRGGFGGAMAGAMGAGAMGGGGPSRAGLPADEVTFPKVLKEQENLNYQTAAIGKWHLADQENGWTEHPQKVGFDYYSGNLFGEPESYFGYSKVVNGEVLPDGHQVYGTTDIVNDATDWLENRDKDNPFFLWVAFNSPHTPFHMPPAELLHSEAKNLDPHGINTDNEHSYYLAMIEAMDTEIGRLLESLSEQEKQDTYIVFMGDNGTPGQVAKEPFGSDHSKGTLYQGGINVPFIISGPNIDAGANNPALTNSVDIFATVMELAGIDIETVKPTDKEFDSISMVSALHDNALNTGRNFTYADVARIGPVRQAIRNQTHKLIVNPDSDELYDLTQDPYEMNNLIGEDLDETTEAQYTQLKTLLDDLLSSE